MKLPPEPGSGSETSERRAQIIYYHWGGFEEFLSPNCERGLPGANEYTQAPWVYGSTPLMCLLGGCNSEGCFKSDAGVESAPTVENSNL
jgi:hypothetical protein